MDYNPQRRAGDYLGNSLEALRQRGLMPPQGAAMRERDLKSMDLGRPPMDLDVDDPVTRERLLAAINGHTKAQQIIKAELVDIDPVADDEDEDDEDDFLAE